MHCVKETHITMHCKSDKFMENTWCACGPAGRAGPGFYYLCLLSLPSLLDLKFSSIFYAIVADDTFTLALTFHFLSLILSHSPPALSSFSPGRRAVDQILSRSGDNLQNLTDKKCQTQNFKKKFPPIFSSAILKTHLEFWNTLKAKQNKYWNISYFIESKTTLRIISLKRFTREHNAEPKC